MEAVAKRIGLVLQQDFTKCIVPYYPVLQHGVRELFHTGSPVPRGFLQLGLSHPAVAKALTTRSP